MDIQPVPEPEEEVYSELKLTRLRKDVCFEWRLFGRVSLTKEGKSNARKAYLFQKDGQNVSHRIT